MKRVIVFVLMGICFLWVSNAFADLQTGLVAYYPFNGSANDESGNGNHGTNNGATLTTDRFGNSNKAYSFDGVDDYIEMAYTLGSQFTLSVWFNSSEAIVQNIIGRADNGGEARGYLFYLNEEKKIKFAFGDGNVWAYEINSNNNAYNLNQWNQAIIIRNNNLMYLYVNGILLNSVNIGTNNPVYNRPTYYVGNNYLNEDVYQFKGKIDNIRIYNRALSEAEVKDLYNLEKPIEEVVIGNQIWSTKNLDVAYYRNGEPIRQALNYNDWVDAGNKKEGAWCYYNYDFSNGTTYGKLYNWYAINDTRGLAPINWHIPSNSEWITLQTYLGGENIAGGKLKESGLSHWQSPNTGATNSSGFTALPGGYINGDGVQFWGLGLYGHWWSSNDVDITHAWSWHLLLVSEGFSGVGEYGKREGFSVRILKDSPPTLQTGLVAHYPFNGNANDESGNGNNGTVNGATLTTDRFGKGNQAYSFDGFDYIEMNNVSLNVNYAISAWFNFNESNGKNQDIIGNADGNNNKGYVLFIKNTNGIQFSWTGQYGWSNDIISDDNVISTNKWYHVSIAKNGANIKIYLNGELIKEGNFPNNPINNLSQNRIGGHGDSFEDWYLRGKLDDIRIYNRALSDEEVADLFWSEAVVQLVSPANTSVSQPRNVTLKWDALNLADSYQLEVSSNSAFTQIITTQNTTSTSYLNTNLSNNKTYYWRVRAKKGDTYTQWSEVWNFTTVTGSIDLDSGLVAHYPFTGGSTQDFSGNGNHGTKSGATKTVDRFGNEDCAYSFDGQSLISIADASSLNFPINGQQTISLWVKKTGNQDRFHFLGKRVGCGSFQYQFGQCYETCNNVGISFGGMNGDNSYASSGLAVPINEWHNYIGIYNGASCKLYCDGKLIANLNSGLLEPTNAPLYIGTSGSCEKFEGIIDDIRIYNRALSDAEVKALYYEGVENALVLVKPNINANITTDTIHFEWDGTEFDRYELYVDNNSGFGSPEVSPVSIKEFLDYEQTTYTLTGNWLSQNKFYWKVIGYIGETKYESNIDSFLYVPQKSAKPNWKPIYRSFNKNVVDHFYTTSASHNNIAELQGYGFEAIEGHLSLTPFEVNSNNGEELVAVYRFYIYNPSHPKYSRHFYVTDEAYKDYLIMQDYHIYEGIIGYTYKNYKQGLTKMYHSYLNDEINQRKDNFYTTKLPEFINSKRFGYDTTNFASFWVSESGNLDIMPELNFGIMSYQEPTVFNLPTGKMGLGFSISYSSLNDFIGLKENPLGINWSHNYQSYSTIEPNSTKIKVYYAGGGIGFFNNSATYQRSTSFGDYNELKKEGNSIYLKTPTQTIFKYDFLDVNINTAYLTSIIDRNGNQITLNYDTKQRLYSVNLYGRSLLFTYYESSGEQFSELIEEVTETGLNRSIKFEYDSLRNLVKYTDPNGNFTHYKYHDILPGWHTITEITMQNGNKIKYEYDDYRKVKSQTITGEAENKTSYTYNLDAATPNVQRKDAYNKITSIDFINSVRAIPNKVTSPSGEIVEIKWNVAHPSKPDTLINTKGKKTIFKYDNNGNVTETLLPMNIKYSFEYNSTNDLLKSVDPKGVEHKYIYDNSGNGNLIEDQAPLNRTTKFTYYSTGAKNGMVKDVTDVLNRKVQFEYNDFGNLTKQIDNIGNITQFNYDGASRLIESIDAKNNKSTNYYNNFDQLIKLINPLNDTVNYSYNLNGNLNSVIDQNGNSTTNLYNSKDQLIGVKNQLNQIVQFDYDLNNVVNKITKPSGDVINYTFWDDGKLKTKFWNNYSALFEYDNVSNLTKITDNNGVIEFTQYDDLNRLISTKDYWNNVVSYTYDDNSNIKSIVYPGNKTVLYEYYDDNSLKTVKDWNGNESKYFYNLDGSLDSIWNQNGTTTKYKYDNNWRIIELINKKSNGEIINSYSYTLDSLGNHISVNKNEPIVAPLPNSEVTNYQYNDANRIISSNNKIYNYDDNGNLSSENNSGVQSNYSFNVANQLLGITGSKSAQYLYDGIGNRVQTIKTSVTRKYIHDMNSSLNNLLMETDENGNVLNYYIYGLGLVSRIKANGTTNYYHYDSRGSTIAMTNSNQEITHKYSYGAYGEILSKTEADNNPFRFVGAYGVIDDENGLYYMRARYYDPSIGRFISEDPIWATNLYWYGDGDPVNYIDYYGDARIKSTTLNISKFNVFNDFIYASLLPISYSVLNPINYGVLHEQIFFEDGTNIGWGPNGYMYNEQESNYEGGIKYYDDLILKEAVLLLDNQQSASNYKLLLGNNCQNYASDLRKIYKYLVIYHKQNNDLTKEAKQKILDEYELFIQDPNKKFREFHNK